MVLRAVFAWKSTFSLKFYLALIIGVNEWLAGCSRGGGDVKKSHPRQRSILSCEKNDSDDCETTFEKFMRCCGFPCLRLGVSGWRKTFSVFFERNSRMVTVKWIPKQRIWLWRTHLIAQLFIEIHCKVGVNQVYSSLSVGARNGCELWFLRFFF